MFNTKRNFIVVSLSLVAILAISAFAVFAQDDTTTNPPNGMGMMNGRGMMQQAGMMQGMMGGQGLMAMEMSEHPMFAAFAEALGLTTEELLAEFQAGQSLADIATEKGVELDVLYATAIASHTEHLAAQVEAGTLTQAEADEHLAWLTENVANHPMFTGQGMMNGMHSMMMGGHGRSAGQSSHGRGH